MIIPESEPNKESLSEEYILRVKDGCILLSHENLEDPNFKVTVVLVCIHNNDGTFGLVCNRPSHMPLSEIFDVDIALKAEKRRIYIGGPVQQENLVVLQLKDEPPAHSYIVASGVYLGGLWESIEDILAEDPSTTRLFLGYSGWGQGQLEDEIREGAWEVFNVNVEQFLINWAQPLFNDIGKIREYLKEKSTF